MKTKNLFAIVVCTLISLFFSSQAFPAVQKSFTDAENQNKKNDLLHFTAESQGLGFDKTGVYITNGARILNIKFGGTQGVVPQAENPSEEASKALPLKEVRYTDLWPGVTLTYKRIENGIFESVYYISPQADTNTIRLVYNAPVEICKNGTLNIKFKTGIMTESAPIAWQEIDGQNVPVRVAFRKNGTHEAGFETGEYNPARPLIIDPKLEWNTFHGSTYDENPYDMAVDKSGNIYIVGRSRGGDSWGDPIREKNMVDGFVVKLDRSGNLVWNTFLGGFSDDAITTIMLDESDNIYVWGASVWSWGDPIYAREDGTGGSFLAKLNNNGDLLWHTFMKEGVHGVVDATMDADGNFYTIGYCTSTWGDPINPKVGDETIYNTSVAKHNKDGSVIWNTFFGGSQSSDYGRGIAVDNFGNIYTYGSSGKNWGNPIVPHSETTVFHADICVVKLDNDGNLLWNTFMGATDYNEWFGGTQTRNIVLDGSGNIYITGSSRDTWGTPINPHVEDESHDVFVAKLDTNGNRLWHTFMGGSGDDNSESIALNEWGDIYVCGFSEATWGTPVNDFAAGSTGDDSFIAKLNKNGVFQWNTFMGSSDDDYAEHLALHGSERVYVAGYSRASWGDPVNPFSSSTDFYALSLSGLDFGDAPAPYPTTLADNGARHTIVEGIYMGNGVDEEADGQPNAISKGDDEDGGADEDGVIFDDPLIIGQDAGLTITASSAGFLNAWVDFNNDGDWADAGEQIFTSQVLGEGVNSLSFAVPAGADTTEPTFARFRFSSAEELSFNGLAEDGEVEDYKVTIYVDTDDDGEPDVTDLCPNDPSKIIPGVCGCGVSEIDTDGDGTPDCNDDCPNDADKTTPGVCGCGNPDIDANDNDIIDCEEPPNLAPVADAGEDRTVAPNMIITLDGSDSYDPDGNLVSFTWEQTGGPETTLSDPGAVKPTFPVPVSLGDTLTFALTVKDDDGAINTDRIIITIVNEATCNTTPDQPVLIFPNNGSININLTPVLQTTEYKDPGDCSTHFKTRWQISEQTDFSGLTYNANTFNNQLTKHQVTKKVLKSETTYYWRVKFWGSHGIKSDWSDVFSFTTAPENTDKNDNGIPDDQEPQNTDVNENGIPDAEESNLRALLTPDNETIGLKFADDIMDIAIETLSPDELNNPGNIPANFIQGLIAFRVMLTQPGTTVKFTVYLPEKAPKKAVWYKYDTVNEWQDFTKKITFSSNRKYLTFQLTDGGSGDCDGVVNGVIVDPAGLAIEQKGTSSPGNSGSSGICFIDTCNFF